MSSWCPSSHSSVIFHVSPIYRQDRLNTVTVHGGLRVGQALDEECDMLPTFLRGNKCPDNSHFAGDGTEAWHS